MDLAGRMKLGEILSMQATRAHVAQTPALYFADEVYTYAELEAACAAVARELHLRAPHTGDAVALALPNVPAFVAYLFGILRSRDVRANVRCASKRSGNINPAFLAGRDSAQIWQYSGNAASKKKHLEPQVL